MMVLAGDIGGTKTNLQICNISKNDSDIVIEQTLPSKSYSNFYELLDAFLLSANINPKNLMSVCFAVAGPIVNGKSRITNLPWVIDEETLIKKYQFNTLKIVNDFTAIGFSLAQLSSNDIVTLHSGLANEKGTKTILGAGTGLGMCMVISANGETMVMPSEIGNTDFAPGDKFSRELTQYTAQSKLRVVYDDILSGAGLENIYAFLQRRINHHSAFKHLEEQTDLAALISESALKGEDPVALQALDHFVKIYAAAARNIALTTFATGGLFIAGGIAPKIINKLNTNTFTNAFLDNKKMHHILKAIPVHVIFNTKAGLLGAIEIAKNTSNNK